MKKSYIGLVLLALMFVSTAVMAADYSPQLQAGKIYRVALGSGVAPSAEDTKFVGIKNGDMIENTDDNCLYIMHATNVYTKMTAAGTVTLASMSVPLASNKMYIGGATGVAWEKTLSGDIVTTTNGAISAAGSLQNATNKLVAATNVLNSMAAAANAATGVLNTASFTTLPAATNALNTASAAANAATNALNTAVAAVNVATNLLNLATNAANTAIAAANAATNALNTADATIGLATNLLNLSTNALNTAVAADNAATGVLNTAVFTTIPAATGALDTAMTTANAATGALNTAVAAANSATNYLSGSMGGVPGLTTSVATKVATVVIQAKTLSGNSLLAYRVMRIWVGNSLYGAPSTNNIASFVINSGTNISTVTANADYWYLTSSTGTCAATVTGDDAGAKYFMTADGASMAGSLITFE